MKSRSIAVGSSCDRSRTALATPRRSARSPPIRGCTFIVPVLVAWKVPIARNSCGTMVRRDAASTIGFTCTMRAPRRYASANAVSIRGAFDAALTAITINRSARFQSPMSQVPLPVPSDACSARPVASWHMFEQSGRLLVPNSRTHN